MFANAWKEVRYHPGRIIATLIAIAISVAFIAASSIFLATQQNSLYKQVSLQVSATDVVITPDYASSERLSDEKVLATIKGTAGVEDAEASRMGFGAVSKGDQFIQIQTIGIPSEKFRYSKITEGKWADQPGELTLTEEVAEKLDASVGDEVKFNDKPHKVVGISDDPTSALFRYIYVAPQTLAAEAGEGGSQLFTVKAKPGTDIEALSSTLDKELTGHKAISADQYREESFKDLAGGINVFKYLFGVFQFIALVVGMIIIANTFTILIAQRRRQIGLLRAVGASGSQVQKQFFAEATLMGVIGGVLGLVLGGIIAAVGAHFTGALYFGLRFPWLEMLVAVVIGVVITLLAAMLPIFKTTKVAPLEALRPVLSADAQKRVSRTRAIITGSMVVIGAVLLTISQFVGKDAWPILWAMAGIFLIAVGSLAAAPLYVAGILRFAGKLIGRTGPTARLATMNSARNPQRAAATAVALMLAMGLIVSLQVATASVRHTVLTKIDEAFPIDLVVAQDKPFKADQQKTLESLPGIQHQSKLVGASMVDPADQTAELPRVGVVATADANLSKAAPGLPAISDDQILVGGDSGLKAGQKLTYKGVDGKDVTLTIKIGPGLINGFGLVTEPTLKKLVEKPEPVGYIMKAVDRGDIGRAIQQIQSVAIPAYQSGAMFQMGGGAMMASMINQLLNILLGVVTALLGVAVAIALVGVANTLGLSVIERQKESALLRALGMKKGSLRLMLLIEALMLALAGALLGLLGGALFAVTGLRAAFINMGIPANELHFSIDPWQTLALLAIAAVCAALASISPGRRAAAASPTAALAEE